jgi:U1 small nuclear ribonucleoprotein
MKNIENYFQNDWQDKYNIFQNYETSESKLRREFERYGKVTKISMVHDKNHKPRGYAFIEYSHKSEMSGMSRICFLNGKKNFKIVKNIKNY